MRNILEDRSDRLSFNHVTLQSYSCFDYFHVQVSYMNNSIFRLNYQTMRFFFEHLIEAGLDMTWGSLFQKSRMLACAQCRNEMLYIVSSYIYEVGCMTLPFAMTVKSEYYNEIFVDCCLDHKPQKEEYISIQGIPKPEGLEICFDPENWSCEMYPNAMFVSFMAYNSHGRQEACVYYAVREGPKFGKFRSLLHMNFAKKVHVVRLQLRRVCLDSTLLEARNRDWKEICAGRVDVEKLQRECRELVQEDE